MWEQEENMNLKLYPEIWAVHWILLVCTPGRLLALLCTTSAHMVSAGHG